MIDKCIGFLPKSSSVTFNFFHPIHLKIYQAFGFLFNNRKKNTEQSGLISQSYSVNYRFIINPLSLN